MDDSVSLDRNDCLFIFVLGTENRTISVDVENHSAVNLLSMFSQTIMGTAVYSCPNCGRAYRHNFTLRRHLKYECGKLPSFQCPFCPHRTKQKANLDAHILNRHQNRTDNPTNTKI